MTYALMEEAWRPPAPAGARPDWMESFAQTISAANKYVVSNTRITGHGPTLFAGLPKIVDLELVGRVAMRYVPWKA